MIERLESRRLMSVSAAQIGTTLVVQSDNQGNMFTVAETAPQVNPTPGEVTVTDIANPLPNPVFEGITRVVIKGGNGGDNIQFFGYTVGTSPHPGLANLNRNLILCGSGNDTVTVYDNGTGSTYVSGGDGDDHLFLNTTNNTILDGGSGNDTLSAPAFGNTGFLFGGSGNDTFIPQIQFDNQANNPPAQLVIEDGGSGDDLFILADGTPAVVLGGSGNDSLFIDSTSVGDVLVAASIQNTIIA